MCVLPFVWLRFYLIPLLKKVGKMETKRLFIGGLYSDITEVDLRDRFKSFGNVLSVEIKRRTDEKGCSLKTFAYLDMKLTDSNFKRCVSLLSNSKWKGCCLKVQAAKESFLTRLERERQQQHNLSIATPLDKATTTNPRDKRHKEEMEAVPDTLPKAVPGTPLPGKKNWVVGKFGRVLPVVYLRRKDRKKITKFDPSKTTHCLKKINLEDSTKSVAGLTWDLQLGNDKDSVKGRSAMVKNEGETKMMVDEQKKIRFGADDSMLRKSYVEKPGKKYAERLNGSNDVTFEDAKLSGSSDSSDVESESFESSESPSESDSNRSYVKETEVKAVSESDGNVSRPKVTTSRSPKEKDNSSMLRKIPPRNTEVVSDLINASKSSASSEIRMRKDDRPHEVFLSSDVLPNNDFLEQTNSIASDRQSSDSSDETTDSDLNKRIRISLEHDDESSNDSSSDSETENKEITNHITVVSKDRVCNINSGLRTNTKSPHIVSDETTAQSLVVKDVQPQVTKDTSKKKMSNEKRLDALEGKKKNVLAQRNTIKGALKDLDRSTRDGKNHIIFGDSDDDGEDGSSSMEKATYSLGEKVSGSKASSWLGLDSDTDEDNVNDSGNENSQIVTVKPHFEGKAGEELFKLQRTFGGDKRFELDSRFLESEEEDEDHHDANTQSDKVDEEGSSSKYNSKDVTKEVEDGISADLKQEKEMALKVLSNLLGGDFRAEFNQGGQEKEPEFRGSVTVHYDPEREDHKQFEQTTAKKDKERIRDEPSAVQVVDDPVLPEVSHEKYYEANTSSLAELFGNKKESGSSFSFLPQETEDDSDLAAADEKPVGTAEEILKNPWQTTQLPYDSSSDSDDYNEEDMGIDAATGNGDTLNKSTFQLKELFFFHADDPELENRINDNDTPFMRIGSEEDVNEYWVSVRSELTQDYKRKRKDAVRRQNKLAAKRTRHR